MTLLPRTLPSPERSHSPLRLFIPPVARLLAIVKLWQRDVGLADIVLLVRLYLLTGLGITVGFHRLATHRGFQSGPVLKFLLLALGSMASGCRPETSCDIPGSHNSDAVEDVSDRVTWMNFLHNSAGASRYAES